MSYAIAVGPAALVGFLAGLLAFRQKCRWCPTCGATFTCPERDNHAAFTTSRSTRRTTNRGPQFFDRRPPGV